MFLNHNATNATESGFWGPVTSNIDWCESNYEITFYIAEFWNTISNLSTIAFALVGAFEAWRERQVELHYIIPFIAMMAVGTGSILFHMSLVYHLQLFDELPMIWGTATIVYAIQELDKSWKQVNLRLVAFLFCCCLVCTLTYLLSDDRLIFEGTYSAMVIFSVFRYGYRIHKTGDHSAIWLFAIGVGIYACGVICWTIDRVHCSHLQSLRQILHPTIRPFSELHAIWHFCSGFGAHLFLILILKTRLRTLSKPYQLEFRLGVFPYYQSSLPTIEEWKTKGQ